MIAQLGIIFVNLSRSFTTITAKVLVAYAPSIFVVAIRTIVAGILLLAIVGIARRNKMRRYARQYWRPIVWGALFRIVIPSNCLYWSLQHMPVGKVALFSNFKPFVTFLMAAAIVGERMTLRKWLGVVIGMAGIVPVLIAQQTMREQALSFYAFISIPELVLLCAIASISYGWIHLRELMKSQRNIPFMFVMGAESLLAGMVSLGVCCALIGVPSIKQPGYFSLVLTFNVILGGVFRRNIRAWLLKHYSATVLSISDLLYPFFTVLIGWLFFSEPIGWEVYVASVLVIIGFYIFLQQESTDDISN